MEFANKIYDKLADNEDGFDHHETDDMILTKGAGGYVIAIAIDNTEYVLKIEEHKGFKNWEVFEPTSLDYEREQNERV